MSWQDCFSWFETVTGSNEMEFLRHREDYIFYDQTSNELSIKNILTDQCFPAGSFELISIKKLMESIEQNQQNQQNQQNRQTFPKFEITVLQDPSSHSSGPFTRLSPQKLVAPLLSIQSAAQTSHSTSP